MVENKHTGVFFYDPENECRNYQEVIGYASRLSAVTAVWTEKDICLENIKKAADKIKAAGITRMVIAGETPGMIKNFFSGAMVMAGNSSKEILLASFREHGAAHADLAKAVISCAVNNIPFELAALPAEADVIPETLVIGGGIAGIQASLEIADAGQKVFLVERTGTIGGYMASFDKTFPTLDCAACILTPKMVDVGQHANITMMTYSEVKEVKGTPGNFIVKILKKARKVNLRTCIGCGQCAEKCPVKVPSEFDSSTTLRKAIYIPFPQAVPNKYMIDAEHCTYITSKKCGVCKKVCPVPDCINYEQPDEEVEINVGNIIVATGYKPFDAARDDRFGYGKFPNVITSLEFERLVNASGPTGGAINARVQDKKGNWVFIPGSPEPKSIAIIHCVGSRDVNYNKYCSKVCCMYSLKLAHLIIEKLPDAEVFEYYIDMRAFGKGYEEFYNRIKHEGAKIIRGRTAKVEEKDGKLLLRSEDILNGTLIEQEVDMVLLAVGLEPREDASSLAKLLNLEQTDDGWMTEVNSVSNHVNTSTGGISVAGVCQGPKDIPDTVAQASAAASRVLQSILRKKIYTSVKDMTLSEIESNISKLSLMEEK